MKYSREYILRRAFDVFMTKGYDSTSISVLQKELSMSRGAMYRYFTNKEELFCAVIDEYFFRLFDRMIHSLDHRLKLSEFIEVIFRRQKIVLIVFAKAGITHTFFLNYTALVIQAAKHYPHFIERFSIINNKLINCWKDVLTNSINSGEVRSDIDVEILSILFNNVCIKESSSRSCDESMFTVNVMKDMEKRKKALNYLFSLIKT